MSGSARGATPFGRCTPGNEMAKPLINPSLGLLCRGLLELTQDGLRHLKLNPMGGRLHVTAHKQASEKEFTGPGYRRALGLEGTEAFCLKHDGSGSINHRIESLKRGIGAIDESELTLILVPEAMVVFGRTEWPVRKSPSKQDTPISRGIAQRAVLRADYSRASTPIPPWHCKKLISDRHR